MDFYCGKKHRYRGIFCKFGESIAKFDEKWGIFESPNPLNGFVDMQSGGVIPAADDFSPNQPIYRILTALETGVISIQVLPGSNRTTLPS